MTDRINDLEERLLLLERRVGLLVRTDPTPARPPRMGAWGHTITTRDKCDDCGITGQAWDSIARNGEMFRCPWSVRRG